MKGVNINKAHLRLTLNLHIIGFHPIQEIQRDGNIISHSSTVCKNKDKTAHECITNKQTYRWDNSIVQQVCAEWGGVSLVQQCILAMNEVVVEVFLFCAIHAHKKQF